MTTATNDGAFWPAPLTAKYEFGCFKKAFGEVDEPVAEDDIENTAFIQFNEEVCEEDGEREPLVKDGGHNCPMKRVDGGAPEMSVLLKAVKLYGQQEGKTSSKVRRIFTGLLERLLLRPAALKMAPLTFLAPCCARLCRSASTSSTATSRGACRP